MKVFILTVIINDMYEPSHSTSVYATEKQLKAALVGPDFDLSEEEANELVDETHFLELEDDNATYEISEETMEFPESIKEAIDSVVTELEYVLDGEMLNDKEIIKERRQDIEIINEFLKLK